ncbi:transcriptional regulator [Shewanella sp. OPT22]|nr:transcriptional regulator [Shewanella sp. OPT22]
MKQLKGMSVFAHIVEEGSISQAADVLGVSKSVISQHLKNLEEELGITLLKRTTRKQSLTTAGENFYQYCHKLNVIAEEAMLTAKDTLSEPQGRLRITASNALMDSVVVPALSNIIKRYPKVKPEFISSDKHIDIASERIDLAIRVGSSKDSLMKQQRIGEFRDVLCAHADLLDKGIDDSIPYVANHWQHKAIVHQLESDVAGSLIYEKEADIMSNSYHTCLALLKNKVGVGVVPDFIFKNVEGIVEVFPNHHLGVNHIYALHPYMQHTPLTVSICIDEIKALLDRSNNKALTQ